MLNKKKCLIGADRDDNDTNLIAVLILIALVIAIVSLVIHLVIYIGAAIGGGYALRNYYLAFKHNVIDNRGDSEQVG